MNILKSLRLISSSTNRNISKTQPSKYIANLMPAEKIDAILNSHYTNKRAKEALLADNYEDFLNARNAELIQKIKDLVQ